MPSTVIKSYNYNKERQSLTIVFAEGNVYEYLEVPEEIYIAFKSFREKGVYLNREIKGKLSFIKIG